MSKFLKDTTFVMIQRVVSILTSFFAIILIARVLGPEGQGTYSLLISTPKLLFNFFNLGVPASYIYLIGLKKYSKSEITETIHSTYLRSYALAVISGISFYFLTKDTIFYEVNPVIVMVSVLSTGWWFLLSSTGLQIQAYQNFKTYSFHQILSGIFFLVSVTFLFLFDIKNVGYYVMSFLCSIFLNFLLDTLYLIRLRKLDFKVKFSRVIFTRIRSFSFKAYLANLSDFFIYRSDMYLIAYFLQRYQVGLYVIAVNIVERIWIFSESIAKVLYVKLASIEVNEKRDLISIAAIKACFLVSLIIAIGLGVFSPVLIKIFFGESYTASIIFLYILLPGVVLQGVGNTIRKILESRGYPGTSAKASMLSLAINIILNLILIPQYEVVGAAVASSVSYSIFFVIQVLNLYRKFQISPYRLRIKFEDLVMVYDFVKYRKIDVKL